LGSFSVSSSAIPDDLLIIRLVAYDARSIQRPLVKN